MPYKDPQRQRDWELRHRPQRLARRSELRRIEAMRKTGESTGFPWPLLLAGGALATFSPLLALGAGSLTLIFAGFRNKDWRWWIVGAFTVVLSLIGLRTDESGKDSSFLSQPDFDNVKTNNSRVERTTRPPPFPNN